MSTPVLAAAQASTVAPRVAVPAVGLVCLACLAVISAMEMNARMPDDAYIYLRIAHNVVERGEWAFNPGIQVNAATSPLYETFLALLVALHLPGLRTPLVLAAAIGLAVLAFAVYRGAAYLGSRSAFLLAAAAASFPTLLRSTGLETPLYLACISLTALFAQEGNEYALGAAAGLATIGRPEGCLVLVLAFGTRWWRTERIPWRGLILALVPVTLWLLFCRHTFGSVVPHTMKIKALQSAVTTWHGSWWLEFLDQLEAPWLAPLAVLGCVVAVRTYRRTPFLGLVIAFGIAQTAGYALLHAPGKYFWYDAPGDLAYTLAAVLGSLQALEWGLRRLSLGQRPTLDPRRVSAHAITAIVAAYLLNCAYWERTHSAPYRISPGYIAAAGWLHDHANPGDWVAADEIGYLGMYSGLPIRDMLGLADPQSIGPLQHGRWAFWFTDSPAPGFIVIHAPTWAGEPGCPDTPWPAVALNRYASTYHQVFQAGAVRIMQRN